jgi:zinc transport system substrate-binding protein
MICNRKVLRSEKMLKKVCAMLAVFMIAGLISACSGAKTEGVAGNSDKIEVAVSFNPMREFVEAVGREKVQVKTIVPEGTEPHDFEMKPKDMQNINSAKIFVYNGLEMEHWVEDSLKSINNKSLIVVEASKGVDTIKNDISNVKDSKEHGEFDPHVWLSIRDAKVQTKNILDALVKVDPSNKDFYDKNYNEFTTKLDSLYNEYKSKFDNIKNKDFVTGHAAFAYLCRDFGLKQNSVEGVFAEGEPTPKKLTEIVDYCKKNNIKVIFMEELVSPKVTETLAKEVGAKVETIYTIESKEDNKDYIESMEDNLKKIYESMK